MHNGLVDEKQIASILKLYTKLALKLPKLFVGVFDAYAKHSIALLAFSQYAEDAKKQGKYLNWDNGMLGDIAFSAVSSSDIAKAAAKGSTYAQIPDIDLDDTLRNVIAYSALVGDDVPFGDVGMQAWFSDMHDLGTVIKLGDVNQIFKEKFSIYGLFTIGGGGDKTEFTEALVRILTQYSGALAYNQVKEKSNSDVQSSAGVLGLSSDGSALALDMSDVLWQEVLASGKYIGTEPLSIESREQILTTFFLRSEQTKRWLHSLLGR